MNEFLRKFDTIRFVEPWNIFRNFLGIFHFFEFKFEFWIWAGFVPGRTGLTGNRSNRTGSHRFGEPWQLVARTGWRASGGWKAVIGYCSVTVTNHSGIWLIRYILKSYTHPWKSFANKLCLVLHACIRLFMQNFTKHGHCSVMLC